MSRRESTRGFGAGVPDPGGWRRHLDPIAWHTILGLVVGFVISAVAGVTLNPYGLRGEDDVEQAFLDGYATGYAEVADQAFAIGEEDGYVRRLQWHLVTGPDPVLDNQFGDGFRQGRTDGWNDALVAMREAAEDVGLEEGAVEFAVLSEMNVR